MPEYSCRVTLRTANWEVSFENVAEIDFTWFSYCQNTSEQPSLAPYLGPGEQYAYGSMPAAAADKV